MRLDLVVGPNGAGKSTFVELVLAPTWPGAAFVNADVIAVEKWGDDAEQQSYEAAKVADAARYRYLGLGRPFIAETVCSHTSKLKLAEDAKAAGYYVALHVLLVPVDTSVRRVAYRVRSGGHSVPEEKIRERYDRLWDVVADVADLADVTTFWDNDGDGPVAVVRLAQGVVVGSVDWPEWTPGALTARWAA